MYCCFFQVVSFGRFRFFCLQTFFDFIFPSLSWSSHWSVCFDSIKLFYLSNAPGGTMQFSVPFSTSSFGEPLSSIYLCFHHVFFCFFCVSFDVFDPIFFFNFASVDFFICIFLEGDVTVLVTIWALFWTFFCFFINDTVQFFFLWNGISQVATTLLPSEQDLFRRDLDKCTFPR